MPVFFYHILQYTIPLKYNTNTLITHFQPLNQHRYATRLLLERGYDVDVTYTSRLKRAIRSSWIMYQEMESVFRPVYKSWRLNERMYGTLEGMSKPGTYMP